MATWAPVVYSSERQHPTRGQRWLPSVYDTQRVSQLYNSTQSPPRCRISSKPYSPYPKSHHLPKIVCLLPAIHSPHTHTHSLYAVKVGYPPKALTAVIPELPLSSLGLAPGDQLIVIQKSGSAASAAAPTSSSSSPANPAYPGHTPAAARSTHTPASNSNPNPRQVGGAPTLSTTIKNDGRPDYVTTDGGYLIHRVRVPSFNCIACVRGMSS